MSTVAIVVGQRGYVWVGRIEQTADEVVMRDSRNIIYWGTTGGLEEIANKGPTDKTKLGDKAIGARRIHRLAVVQLLECQEAPWTDHL